jgi:hypothetical protein
VLLAVSALLVAGMTLLAIADREAAYMTLYLVGSILLLLGSAAGLGGGAAGRMIAGESPSRAYREDMHERAAWLSHNLVILFAGALLVGIGVLLNLA